MAIKASGGSTSRTRRSRRASLSAIRSFYARFVTASAGVADERIVHAFAALPREDFLGPGPWQVEARGYISTGTDDPAVLYQNMLVGLAPERRINTRTSHQQWRADAPRQIDRHGRSARG